MELLEDPIFKSKYQKYKLRVKLWESDFMEKYGRKPNKNDIKDANSTIKEAYKMYWKLKTRALEETLTDITFSEDIQANISVDLPKKVAVEKRDDKKLWIEDIKNDTENINSHNVIQSHDSSVTLRNEPILRNVDNFWGDDVKKSNEMLLKKKTNLLVGRSSSFQLSQNKFTSSIFTKRNPRKSLSMTKLKSKSEKNSTSTTKAIASIKECNTSSLDVNEKVKTVFGEPVKVVSKEPKVASQSINTIQQLMEVQLNVTNRQLNEKWLNRCFQENNKNLIRHNSQALSCISDSGIESTESSIYSPRKDVYLSDSVKSPLISDEEDFICNSDSEEERRNKRIRNFKKRLSDQDRDNKRFCTDIDSNSLHSQPLPTKPDIFCDNTLSNSDKTILDVTTLNNLHTINDKITTSTDYTVMGDMMNQDEGISLVDNVINNVVDNIVDNVSKDETRKFDNNIKDTTCNIDENEKNKKDNTPVSRTRNVRRRLKPILSDDCGDSDFVPNNKSIKKSGKRITRSTRSTKKVESNQNSNDSVVCNDKDLAVDEEVAEPKINNKKNKNIKKVKDKVDNKKQRKSSRTLSKKIDKSNVEDCSNSNTELTEDNNILTYGVETLEAIPRFPIPSSVSGNLITDFSNSVALTSSDLSDIHIESKSKGQLSDKEKLEHKIAAGSVNDNFIRINLKKKVFVRGKKSFNFSKHKKNQWKQKKKVLESSEKSLIVADFVERNGVSTCFKCGDIGHFAKNCTALKSANLLPLVETEECSQYPTLEEAEKMAKQNALISHSKRIDRLPERPLHFSQEETKPDQNELADLEGDLMNFDFSEFTEKTILQGHIIPTELTDRLFPPHIDTVKPLYITNEDHSLIETPKEVFEILQKFGHESFRPGQEKAIMRILSGQSTLITLSTGSGKSLCYQLPAYLYSKYSTCITLVVSPLVSLMDDQVTGVPSFLSAACLHTNQTPKVRDTVMQRVKQSKIQILLVSPEAIVAGEKSSGFGGTLFKQLPPIAFACIDEAHCISQWSYNFRPSYLMVCRVLKEKLGVKTILGLTATATKITAQSIVNHLGIHDGIEGVLSDIPLPNNLFLTVSKDEYKDAALINLLKSERFQEYDSIIIYCIRREECARIAGLLRATLQVPQKTEKANAKVSAIAEAYHAGLTSYQRKLIQKAFMNNQIKIVVATVAFGMGINKPNIRSVIHYNMPGTFEGYVQEVGRAGRDGHPAYCHLFLNSVQGNDKLELRRHIYANGVDRHTIRRLLEKVFIPCSCAKINKEISGKRCPGHEVAISIDETVRALDITQETISTLLCYLELHPKRFITVLSSVYVNARVSSYNGSQALKVAAQSCPPLAMAIALDLKKGISHENSTVIEFPVVDIASIIGWDSGIAKSSLKDLEWTKVNGKPKRSAISVRFDTLGLRVRAPGDLTDTELDEVLETLINRTQSQEMSSLQQLETISSNLNKCSVASIKQCLITNDETTQKFEQLKNTIRSYFQSEISLDNVNIKLQDKILNESQIVADIRNLILSYKDTNFTGRAIARIFHGIQSPNYPAIIWGRCRFWRAHISSNFNVICQIATKEILALR